MMKGMSSSLLSLSLVLETTLSASEALPRRMRKEAAAKSQSWRLETTLSALEALPKRMSWKSSALEAQQRRKSSWL